MNCSRCKNTIDNNIYKHCNKCREYNKNYRDSIPRQYKQGFYSSKDNMHKICSDCKEYKILDCFYKNKRYKDGYINQCKICHSERWKIYYNKDYNVVLKNKLKNDPVYRLKQNERSYLHQQLNKKGLIKNDNTENYLGCPISKLKKWLEYQFTNEMSWEDKKWQIDHIIPISIFDLNNPDEIKMAFHWTNLQPLSKKENLEKYNKFKPIDYFNSLLIFFRFIKHDINDITIVQQRFKWIKTKFSLQHFQIAGNS